MRFRAAPRNRGTEISVELDYEVPGGSVVAVLTKLVGEGPGQQLRDVLRRFKQAVESEGSREKRARGLTAVK